MPFFNGYSREIYFIPYGACPECEQSSGKFSEYSFLCPKVLRSHPNLNRGDPMPLKKSAALLKRIGEVFEEEGIHYRDDMMPRLSWLQPGVSFGDREFSIGCHPPHSFMWGEIGGWGPIAKQDVKDAFEKENVTGVTFLPVKIKHVGSIEADAIDRELLEKTVIPHWWTEDEIRIDVTDDPPNIIPPEKHPERFGPLYHMSVPFSGLDWRNWGHMPKCTTCGREKKPERPKKMKFRTKNLLDLDVFRSSITNCLVITQRVYEIIMDNRFTNCQLTKLHVAK